MNYRRKLFSHRKLYDTAATDPLFFRAVQENLAFHTAHCPAYDS